MKRRVLTPTPLLLAAGAPFVFVVGGTLGYRYVEGWPWFDALYMAVITLTTVGFGETHPLGTAGRVFTICFVLSGVFTLFFTTTEVLRWIVSGELQTLLGRRRMEKKIEALTDHVVVCGYGRMGRQICLDLAEAGVSYVVVDLSADKLADHTGAGGHAVVGDATDDEVLKRAGIDRARAVVAVTAKDADNLFVTMSARLLRGQVPIIARAEDEASTPKLLRAGATRVVSPYVIAGGRVVHAVLRPAVLDFIEVATRREHMELQIEELQVAPTFDGRALRDFDLGTAAGLIIVALKRRGEHMIFNPSLDTRLAAGDTLVVLGRQEQLLQAVRFAEARLTGSHA